MTNENKSAGGGSRAPGEKQRRPGRPRGASSERLASGKRGARVTLTIDGESVRKRVQLETADPAVAAVKIDKLQSAELAAEPTPAADTFREVARVVFAERAKRGVHRVDIEVGRVDNHVLPFVGQLVSEPFGDRVLASITPKEVVELLAAKRDEGYSLEQLKKIRTAIGYVFRHGGLDTMTKVAMPPMAAALKKARAVASDEVLLAYLGWEHPVERFRAGVRMRQAMSAVSRCIGGQRTNDLHVATWQDNLMVPEEGEPDFSEVWVPRTKKQAPQLLETPEGVRPMLRLWWEWSGRPRTGPVFPLIRGDHAGEAREVQDSHAEALRRDLRRALGIEVWDPGVGAGERGPQGRWVPGRSPTAKEKTLFEEGRYTLPVDFHSWRRAWSQGLRKAGANVQTSAAITGHASDLRAHGRYLESPTEAMVVPAGAVPNIGRLLAETHGGVLKNRNDIERARVDSNHRPLASEGNPEAVFQGFSHDEVSRPHSENHVVTTGDDSAGRNPRTELPSLGEALTDLVTRAMKEGDLLLAKELFAVAERRRAQLPDNVRPLARKGGKP